MKKTILLIKALFFVIALLNSCLITAQVVYSYTTAGSIYSQNFDGLPIHTVTNSGIGFVNGTTTTQGPFDLSSSSTLSAFLYGTIPAVTSGLTGWQFYKTTATNVAGINADEGSASNTNLHSYGTANSTDRALGAIRGSSLAHVFGMVIQNNTGVTLTSAKISYTGEQWRVNSSNSGNTALNFTYKMVTAASGTIGNGINQTSMTSQSNLYFTSPANNSNSATGAVNGNSATYQTKISYTITGLTWANGDYLVIRWDGSTTTNPHGLAVDDFTFLATGTGVKTYYSNSSGDLASTSSWGTVTDGSGTQPSDFTTSNQVFVVSNRASTSISSDWTVSGSGSAVIIGDGTSANPVNLTIPSGVNITANISVNNYSTLTLQNTVAPSTISTLASGSTVVLNAGSIQSVPALTYGNLTINNSAGVSLAGNVTVNNGLNIGSGTLTTGANTLTVGYGTIGASSVLNVSTAGSLNVNGVVNGSLVNSGTINLLSSLSGTASIGKSAGSISGNVTVQRYIGGNAAWRGIGLPFTTATGLSGSSAPLSAFITNPAQAYYFNESNDDLTNYGASNATPNAGWTPFISSTSVSANKGILIWGSSISGAQILSFTGPVNANNQTLAVTKDKSGWNFLANPFASNISWTNIAANSANTTVLGATTAAVYRVNPLGNGSYSFSSYIPGTGATNGGSDVIENGASYFVQAVAAGNLTIREADKTSNAVTADGGVTLFGTGNTPTPTGDGSIKLALSKTGSDYSDEVLLKWNTQATESFNRQYDALDLGTYKAPDLTILGNDNTRYSIFNGSGLHNASQENRVIKLGLKSLTEGEYVLNSSILTDLNYGNQAYIVDNYTHDFILIDHTSPQYRFTVTNDTLSKSDRRLTVVLNYAAATSAIMINNTEGFRLAGNVTTANQFTIYSGKAYQKVAWRLVDASGRVLETGNLNNVSKGSNTTVGTSAIKASMYFIQLQGDCEQPQTLKWNKL